jgi:ketosteroid isomerase-like protein
MHLVTSSHLSRLARAGPNETDARNATPSLEKTMTINETNNEAAIRGLIDRFAKAFCAKDVDGCMSVFAPEIVSFDILPPLQAVGAETFVKHWQEFFDSYRGPIHVEFPDVSIIAGDDVAFSYCLHRITGTLKNGHETDFWLRWTAGWRKANDKWLIVHEQVSVPVDLGSGKALMDLKP